MHKGILFMRNFNKLLTALVVSLFMLSVFATLSDAKSLNPLEIGFPREAGTGSPAIPATHPVFRAYPGVTYTVRPAIYGGAYPYTFSLANQPEGMVIDSATGLITWPDPQASTGPITLTVTDADGTQAQSTWSVSVSTTGFVFVDAAYSGVETGSISQPYSSIAAMLNAATSITDIVYFRAGTHTLPVRGTQLYWVGQGCKLTFKPTAWIGYPGETVTIDMAQHYIEGASSVYFSSLSFINIPDWAVRALSNAAYSVIRDCSFSAATAQYTTNLSSSVYSNRGSSDGTGYYAVFQNNTLTNSSGVGLVSLKDQDHALIEHNTVSGVTAGTQGSKALIENVQNNVLLTVRTNDMRSTLDSVTPLAGDGKASTTETTYNFFKGTNVVVWIGGDQSNPPGKTDLYRNTIHGRMIVNYLDGSNCGASGPYSFDSNVFISNGSPYYTVDYIGFREGVNIPETCFPRTNNIIDNTWFVSDVIDANGNLLPAYTEFIGVIGWQLGSAVVPGTLSLTPADGLAATGAVGGPFSPSSATYTLQNTGDGSLDWSASKTQPWLTLSSTGGSLGPGATATVTATLTSQAESLAIGAYDDTIIFANLTNGNGSASRDVTLTVNSLPVSLFLSVNPSAAGTVSANPAKSAYDIVEQVTLTARPVAGYAFAGWSGDAAAAGNPLTITMDGQKTVTATFTLQQNLRTGSSYYDTLKSAFAAVASGSIILARGTVLADLANDATFNRSGVTATLRGGYTDAAFSVRSATDFTSVTAPLVIEYGTLILDQVSIM
jgi:uncharacterized repeat protein (TIGR02543 family)